MLAINSEVDKIPSLIPIRQNNIFSKFINLRKINPIAFELKNPKLPEEQFLASHL